MLSKIVLVHLIVSFVNSENAKSSIFNETQFELQTRSKLSDSIMSLSSTTWKILQMIDSWSKIPTGFLTGRFFDLGNFDECYNLDFGENVYGRYCLAMYKVPAFLQNSLITNVKKEAHIQVDDDIKPKTLENRLIKFGPEYLGFFFATCSVSTMPLKQLNYLVPLAEIRDEFCVSKSIKPILTFGASATILFLGGILFIAILSTIYETILIKLGRKPKHQILIAFSFVTNGKKLFDTSQSTGQLSCLNGIKALSMFWVVLGHTYSNILNAPIGNLLYIATNFLFDQKNMLIIGSTLSVDTFFTVGGLVTVYTFLNAKKISFNFLTYYLHRFLRLTPALAVVILVQVNLVPYLPKGPFWFAVELLVIKNCQTEWWKTLFYLYNYVSGNCVSQCWYLSVDFHLFLLSPLFLLPLAKRPKIGLLLIVAFILLGCTLPFLVAIFTPIRGFWMDNDSYMNNYYYKTHTRFGPYFIGMLAGYLIHFVTLKQKLQKVPSILIAGMWTIVIGILFGCLYIASKYQMEKTPNPVAYAFFLAFNRNIWAVAICCLICLCAFGFGSVVNKFLSLPVFVIITKLSYSIYLVHYSFILIRNATLRAPIDLSNFQMMHSFWGNFMFSCALAVCLCLLFESPVIAIEKILFKR